MRAIESNGTSLPHAGRCQFCPATSMRRSRVRADDLPRILLLQWPVRCLGCGKRQYVLWPTAYKAVSSRAPHAPELREKESWQHFTGDPVIRIDRHNEDDR